MLNYKISGSVINVVFFCREEHCTHKKEGRYRNKGHLTRYIFCSINCSLPSHKFVCKMIVLKAKREDCMQKRRNVPLDISDEKDDRVQVSALLQVLAFLCVLFGEKGETCRI